MLDNSNVLSPVRRWHLLVGTVILFGLYFGFYATVSGANVAYLAWFSHVPMIEKFFAGTWSFHDAIQRYGEHGLFGYNLLLMINLKFFDLNVFFDIYLNVVIVAGVGLVVARAYYRTESFAPAQSLAVVLFLPVAFALFSVSQQSSGAMETQVRFGTIFYLISAYWIDRILLRPNPPNQIGATITGVILIGLAVLVFGTLYTFAGFPGLGLLCFYAVITRPKARPFAVMMMLALVVSVFAYIRFYDLQLDSSAASPMGLLNRVVFAFQFLATYLGSATLGRTLWEDKITTSDALLLGNGIFVSSAYLFALWTVWRTRMYRITWMPVLMIAYSVGVGALVLIGRGVLFGWTGGTNYWYAVHAKFALGGCLWIFAHALLASRSAPGNAVDRPSSNWWNIFPCAAVTVIFVACLVISNIADWRRAPYVREYFNNMIPFGLGSLDEMPVDQQGQTPFRASLTETVNSLRVLREHGLSFYATHKLPNDTREHDVFVHGGPTEYARLGPGWYQAEGNARWMSGRAQITFQPGPENVLVVEGYVPSVLAPNAIMLSIDGQAVTSQPLSEGIFHVVTPIPSGSNTTLTIEFSKHLIPRSAGLNNDERDLAAMITRITVR